MAEDRMDRFFERFGSWFLNGGTTIRLLGFIFVYLVFVAGYTLWSVRSGKPEYPAALLTEIADKSTAQIKELRAEVETTKRSIEDFRSQVGVTDTAVLRVQLKEVQNRLSKLEEALSSEPSKALAIPLLRRDIEALQERSRNEVLLTREELGRLYTLMQWFLGTFMFGGVAVLIAVWKATSEAKQAK